ncbi:MAG: dicarboxylate/amino acid:cation symporter [Saprospiraceae bacterium]|nr:dicarboxylate/amino acid:cation symporter [Saprospiraceae bacterium]
MKGKKLALHWKIIIALILGIGYSFLSTALGWTQFTKDWINPFGEIFIRLLKFISVPLVLFSIISGVASLPDLTKLGRVGAKTLGLYLITTLSAVGLGIILVNTFQPGSYIAQEQRVKNRIKYELWAQSTEGTQVTDGKSYLTDPQYADLVSAATADMQKEQGNASLEQRLQAAQEFKTASPLQFLVEFVPDNIFVAMSDTKKMLQVIFFALFFGIVLVTLPAATSKPVIDVVNGASEVFVRMVDIVMKAAPFFVFALMAGIIAQMASTTAEVIEVFKGLLSYSLTVLSGLALMLFVVYPTMILTLVRKISYSSFFRRISPAQFLAFSTSSSAATLPVTMECTRDNLGVSQSVTNFVLPIGATVNMDGTSLYQAVAAIFLAQIHLVDLSFAQQMTVLLTAALASIGTAAIPSAGLVMLIVVLQAVGLNPAWIAIIIPVDRILDMCRTVINVTSDITVSTVVASTEGELNVPAEPEN